MAAAQWLLGRIFKSGLFPNIWKVTRDNPDEFEMCAKKYALSRPLYFNVTLDTWFNTVTFEAVQQDAKTNEVFLRVRGHTSSVIPFLKDRYLFKMMQGPSGVKKKKTDSKKNQKQQENNETKVTKPDKKVKENPNQGAKQRKGGRSRTGKGAKPKG